MGCDNVLESGAETDTCGVCNGDGSSATKTNNTLTGSGRFGYHTVAVVPAGARDVRIAESVSTSSVYLGKILNSYTATYMLATYMFICIILCICIIVCY